MSEAAWTHLGVLAALAGICLTIWKMRREDLKEIDRRLQTNSIELAAFKLQVADGHPTVADLANAESRFMEANRETIRAINNLSGRIDRLLEREGR